MNKFSKLSGIKVNEAPAPSNEKVSELDVLKTNVLRLMDSYLSIQSYGSVSPVWRVPTKIAGKELFVEALMDLFEDKSTDEKVSLLESLKSDNFDWLSIDKKINQITNNIPNINNNPQILKVKKLIESHHGDIDELTTVTTIQSERMTNSDNIFNRYAIVESMISSNKYSKYQNELKAISKVYLDRYNKLKEDN